ncbi:MAG TPA: aspartyl protease family protein [Acidobacteriaceae bacterium]
MPKICTALRNALLLLASLCILTSLGEGQDRSASLENGPDAEVSEFNIRALELSVQAMTASPERDYFSGVLANRTGQIDESIRLLNSALPAVRTTSPARAAIALQALADDYNKRFQYGKAEQAYEDLLANFPNQLKADQLQGTKDDAGVARILRSAPVQTIVRNGPTRLKTKRNPLGLINVSLTVNGVKEAWLLDTGANLSVVTKSFAKRLGLTLLPGTGQALAGLTGIENPLRVALIPTLQMGGATLHNVVVMVLDDSNLRVGPGKDSYQIQGILGYPVFEALGTITFLHDGGFESVETTQPNKDGARMYMKLLTPVIEGSVEGEQLPFSFDTGAQGTNLLVRYYNRFHNESSTWTKAENKSFGAGGGVQRTIYVQPRVRLGIGNKTVTLKNIPIFTSASGSDIDELYGNLGQDVVAGFDSFTFDFAAMKFRLGEPLSPPKTH